MSASRTSSLTPQYGWSERSGRYYSLSTGRFVSFATIRSALDAALDAAGREIVSVTNALRTGNVTLAAWQTAMESSIASAHLASAALARGGWAQLTQGDLRRVEVETVRQFAYLRDWASDIAAGIAPRDGRMLVRATLYNDAARTTYHVFEQSEMIARGMREMRRERHARESCDDCVTYEALGWTPIGELPLPGQASRCLTRCRCTVAYR